MQRVQKTNSLLFQVNTRRALDVGEVLYKLRPHIEGTQLVLITDFNRGPNHIRVTNEELRQLHSCFDWFHVPIDYKNDNNYLFSVYSTFVRDPSLGIYRFENMENPEIGELRQGRSKVELNTIIPIMSKLGGRFLWTLQRRYKTAKSYPPSMGVALQWKRYQVKSHNDVQVITYGFHKDADCLDHGMSLLLSDPSTINGGEFNTKPNRQRHDEPAISVRPEQYEAVIFGNREIYHGITTATLANKNPATRDVFLLHTYVSNK